MINFMLIMLFSFNFVQKFFTIELKQINNSIHCQYYLKIFSTMYKFVWFYLYFLIRKKNNNKNYNERASNMIY